MQKRIYKLLTAVSVLIFVIGAGLFLYPFVTRQLSGKQTASAIENYNRVLDEMRSEITKEALIPPETQNPGNTAVTQETEHTQTPPVLSPLTQMYYDLQEYNRTIYENGQAGLKDQDSYQNPLFSMRDYGLDTDIFGYIEIPKMNVTLPIYLGASKANMSLGAVHLTYTSLPIDQENTNTVIAAHRGNGGADFFRHIELLENGDPIIVTTPFGIVTYRVCEITIISKNEIEKIRIQSGRKLLTLSSCHPYTKNTHRYLVFAELVSSNPYI